MTQQGKTTPGMSSTGHIGDWNAVYVCQVPGSLVTSLDRSNTSSQWRSTCISCLMGCF